MACITLTCKDKFRAQQVPLLRQERAALRKAFDSSDCVVEAPPLPYIKEAYDCLAMQETNALSYLLELESQVQSFQIGVCQAQFQAQQFQFLRQECKALRKACDPSATNESSRLPSIEEAYECLALQERIMFSRIQKLEGHMQVSSCDDASIAAEPDFPPEGMSAPVLTAVRPCQGHQFIEHDVEDDEEKLFEDAYNLSQEALKPCRSEAEQCQGENKLSNVFVSNGEQELESAEDIPDWRDNAELQSKIGSLSAKFKTELSPADVEFVVQTKQIWGKRSTIATMTLSGHGSEFKGEGDNAMKARIDALEKAIKSVDAESRRISRRFPASDAAMSHIIGKDGDMKGILEAALQCDLKVKNKDIFAEGCEHSVNCFGSLLKVAEELLGEGPANPPVPSILKDHWLNVVLPACTVKLVASKKKALQKQHKALIVLPRHAQTDSISITVSVLSLSKVALLATQLELIACACDKFTMDNDPDPFSHVAHLVKEGRSEFDGPYMDVMHIRDQRKKPGESDTLMSYLIGNKGQLAGLVAKVSGCQVVRYFSMKEGDVKQRSFSEYICACIVGNLPARRNARMCIEWLQDQWRDGRYADVSDQCLKSCDDLETIGIPIAAKQKLNQELVHLGHETSTMCFFRSVPKDQRENKEYETLVIFSCDEKSRLQASTKVSALLGEHSVKTLFNPATSCRLTTARRSIADAAKVSSIASSSCISSASGASWVSAPACGTEPHCFLPRTSFLRPDGTRVTAVQLRSKGGDVVQGPSGEEVTVLSSHRIQPKVERDVVKLLVEGNGYPFQITANHPLDVEGPEGFRVRRKAGEVRRGDRLDNGSFWARVSEVSKERKVTEVVEIKFEKDMSVLAWVLPPRSRSSAPRPQLRGTAAVSCGGAFHPHDFRRIQIRNTFLNMQEMEHKPQQRSLSANARLET